MTSPLEPRRAPSYLKAAFWNPYNLSLLGGALSASVLSGEYVLGAVAVGLEAFWLIFGPDAHPFKRWVNRQEREEREKEDRARVAKLMESLPEREWARAHAIDELKREIERDMQTNPSFQAILLQTEIDKLEQLHMSFVSLATACVRAETYLSATDPRDLQKQIDVQGGVEKNAKDDTVRHIAKKNITVLEKRLETMKEIQNFLARARGQMNLIENTVRLLRDQVLTMASPAQLGEQLDDLLTGVDAIQQSAKDQEIFNTIQLDPIAPISSDAPAMDRSATKVR